MPTNILPSFAANCLILHTSCSLEHNNQGFQSCEDKKCNNKCQPESNGLQIQRRQKEIEADEYSEEEPDQTAYDGTVWEEA